MLILGRFPKQKIRIGSHIMVTVLPGNDEGEVLFYIENCRPYRMQREYFEKENNHDGMDIKNRKNIYKDRD